MRKYLDNAGLSHLWGKIKSYVDSKSTSEVYDGLDSNVASDALSANMGRVLNLRLEDTENALGGWKIFSSHQELGVSASATAEEVCAAMPAKSIANLPLLAHNNPVLPLGTMQIFEIIKINDYRATIKVQRNNSGNASPDYLYMAHFNSLDSPQIQGWKRVTTDGWFTYSTPEELGLPNPASLDTICAAMPEFSTAVMWDSQITDNPASGFGIVKITKHIQHRVSIMWQRGSTFSAADSGYLWFANWRVDSRLSPWQRVVTDPRLLWSGSWDSGSITVPGFSGYTTFLVRLTTVSALLYATRYLSVLRGSSHFPDSDRVRGYYLTASYSGDVLTHVNSLEVGHKYSGNHTSVTNRGVSHIWGLA